MDRRRIAIGSRCPLPLFSFCPFAFLVSSTAVTSVETSTLKGRYGGQMRRDKGKGRVEDQDESVGDWGRIVRILERHGDERREDTSLGCRGTSRPNREREKEAEEETSGVAVERREISSRSRFLGTRGPRARLLQSVFARSIFRIRLGSCSFCSAGQASLSWPR